MDNKCIWSWIWDIAMTPLLWKPLGHIRWSYNYFPYAEIKKAFRGAWEDVIPLFAIYLINFQCVMSDIYELTLNNMTGDENFLSQIRGV